MSGPAPGEAGTPRRWRITGYLAVVAAVNFADRSAFNAVLAPLRGSLHLSDATLGTLVSLFLWSYALASPFAGNLADRYSRSALVVWSLVLWSLCTLLTGAANSLALLCVLRVGLGLGESVFSPAAFALVADHHAPERRGVAMSILSLSFQAGIVAGSAGAGYLAQSFGWRAGFYVMGGVGVVLAAVAPLFIGPPSTRSGSLAQDTPARMPWGAAFRYVAGVPTFLLVMLKQFLSEMTTWVLLTWIPLFLFETFHLKLGEAGFVGTAMLAGAIVAGMAVGGWVSDWVGAPDPRRRMLLLAGYYLLAAPFLLVFLLHPSYPLVVAAISACSLIRGMATAAERPVLCDVIPAPYRSTVFGFYNSVANLGGGAGVILAGVFKRSLGLHGVFAALSGLFVMAAAGLLAAHRWFMAEDMRRAQNR